MLYNNKLLAAVFVGLLALYAVTKVVKANQGSRSFKSQIASVDTSLVKSVLLYPQIEQKKEVRFNRSLQGWIVQRGQIQALAESGKLATVLGDLRSIKPQRLVANEQAKWAEYQLTDSLATQIKLLGDNNQELLTVLIGKVGAGGETFVRLPNENEIYAIDSYLSANANKGFNDWRNQEVLSMVSSQIEKVSFTYVTDSSFTLEKSANEWKMGETIADSALVAQFLNQASGKRSKDFEDGYKPQGKPAFIVVFSGKQMTIKGKPTPQVIVQGFEANGEVYLRTSINPNTLFKSKKSGLFQAIFKKRSDFIKKKEEEPEKTESNS